VSEVIATRRLVTRLLVVVVVMFCFGIFILPPFYDAMCRVFGINGKTAGAYQGEQLVDEQRQVRVQFLATNARAAPGARAVSRHQRCWHGLGVRAAGRRDPGPSG